MSARRVIAIDGPAGSGKSTVARALARRLRLPHIDTGSIYRAMTLKVLQSQVAPDDEAAVRGLAAETKMELRDGSVFLDGEDVSDRIRSREVTALASLVSAHPEVRKLMVELQRRLVPKEGAVVEGRDIGTVVLPGADLKVFLTGAPEERARRRTAELNSDGVEVTFEEVLADITARDHRDSSRPVSPLGAAPDAFVIDSTEMQSDQVVEEIVRLSERQG